MFERKYEIVPNAPAHMSWDDYSKASLEEYRELLETASDNEMVFQHFLRKTPLLSQVHLNSLGTLGTTRIHNP